MDRTPTGVIRKIVIGLNPKDEGLAFSVGQRFGDKTITDIVEDLNQFHLFGCARFLIYAKISGESVTVLWKAFERVPVTLEYDLYSKETLV